MTHIKISLNIPKHRRTLEDDHEDYVRVVSGVIGSNGSNGNVQPRSRTGRFQPSCSKLDIIR